MVRRLLTRACDRTFGGGLAVLLVLGVSVGAQSGAAGQPRDVAAAVDDVERAFARIESRGEQLTVSVNGLIQEPWYQASVRNWFGFRNHFQGIQRVTGTNYLVMSGSNVHAPMGSLFVIRMDAKEPAVVARVPVDSEMWHAGGLSMDGHVLAVPVYGGSPLGAKVVFFDMRTPENPVRLAVEIDRPGEKAYAVALTRLPNRHYLAAVLSDRDGMPRRLDVYLSRSTEFADGFNTHAVRWFTSEVLARDGQDRNFGDFQGLNFVRQTDGRLYLIGFHNTVPSVPLIPGRDYADLYEMRIPDEMASSSTPSLARPSVVKVASSQLYCKDGYCNMDAAAGIHVDPETGALQVYAAPGWIDDDRVKLTVYRQR